MYMSTQVEVVTEHKCVTELWVFLSERECVCVLECTWPDRQAQEC